MDEQTIDELCVKASELTGIDYFEIVEWVGPPCACQKRADRVNGLVYTLQQLERNPFETPTVQYLRALLRPYERQ